ncbi:2,3-bisphosphoglycerate-independent phosphoglycerate mutase [Paracoccus sp. (in: a-proteobacteria)]|uniref:2,3-bisphosphoglycerate-independent phosphoglycerate mutase n=1 Tax=Paracoccus sp. TaxID=267 RepID=UPI0026DFEB79|nr:2,3-bisphosphoglycerate-independent phosphoglycerate mutase [Paracoccus sp. (in: a-proteobacteria)]MDO5647626.1 2,3-bisphosphoglycerate-independent phosphoglycerate mutase [Paracoccus sp. (in: a-proteobacteria)]
MTKPVVLCILDGWGLSETPEHSAPACADTPNFDRLMAECPNGRLITYGPDVGLPTGQMGNSEVGHTNIGAGRVVAMDLGQIDLAVEDGSFANHPALLDFAARLRDTGGAAHLMGVVSDGGVHGHLSHVLAAARAVADQGVPVIIHAITDGRDVAPDSAVGFMAALQDGLPVGARIGTVIGRYYAMDRDNRWERVERAYRAIVDGIGEDVTEPRLAISTAYGRDQLDEFIPPFIIDGYNGAQDGDGFFCLNFRADRAREILSAVADPDFAAFDVSDRPEWAGVLGMVDYSARHTEFMQTVYPKQQVANTLGAWVAAKGLRQFRLAETEKYPHVTFFLNGGKETPEPGEDRFMPASPKVATYDLAPEMAADEVSDQLVAAIHGGYDLIVVNYANPDMVGHTGSLTAAMAACQAVDRGLGRMIDALDQVGGAAVICADHGNCEQMVDPDTGGPHTAHTLNPVPVIVYRGPAGASVRDGRLADLAPTVLALMGLDQPVEMTGKSLLS